jgi:hypothetical protein
MVLKKDRTRTNEKIVLSPVLKVTHYSQEARTKGRAIVFHWYCKKQRSRKYCDLSIIIDQDTNAVQIPSQLSNNNAV